MLTCIVTPSEEDLDSCMFQIHVTVLPLMWGIKLLGFLIFWGNIVQVSLFCSTQLFQGIYNTIYIYIYSIIYIKIDTKLDTKKLKLFPNLLN